MSDFEAELIHHAAPTLLGRKQSNLFSLPLSLLPKKKSPFTAKNWRKKASVLFIFTALKTVYSSWSIVKMP